TVTAGPVQRRHAADREERIDVAHVPRDGPGVDQLAVEVRVHVLVVPRHGGALPPPPHPPASTRPPHGGAGGPHSAGEALRVSGRNALVTPRPDRVVPSSSDDGVH